MSGNPIEETPEETYQREKDYWEGQVVSTADAQRGAVLPCLWPCIWRCDRPASPLALSPLSPFPPIHPTALQTCTTLLKRVRNEV